MDFNLESKLANHKIFKDIKDGLAETQSGKLRNLLELKDDVLYVWNSVEICLLTLNLKQFEEHGEETPYQRLDLLTPPAFSVERLSVSVCGSRVCVWGSWGVTLAELPSRWGRGGLFDSGKPTVLCKSCNVDERFLYTSWEVRRVHWHPGSLSHLLVLVSDNTIRLYNIAMKTGPKLVKIFSIGPKPSWHLADRTVLDSLGDTAVDFTPTPDAESLLILRGNGDVYMMQCDLEGKSPLQPRLQGPLAMYPPADDNYGSESCCLLALGGDVPLVVVATCSGALYHCLLLPNAPLKEDADSHALYVLEAVELSMTLNPDSNDMQSSHPVHLYPCVSNSYVCVHAGGVHAVALPMLEHLVDFAAADDGETEAILASLGSAPSAARHLVCTGNTTARPPAGLAITTRCLPSLLVLCADGVLLTRTLEPFDLEEKLYKEMQLKNPALEQDDIKIILKERQKLSFTAIIQEILSRDVSQPILNLSKEEEPSPKECLEMLRAACARLRGGYVCAQQVARDASAAKLRALLHAARRHAHAPLHLQKEIEDVKLQSTVLQEKCLLAQKHQEDIKYRCSAVLRRVRGGALSGAERALLGELRVLQRGAERAALLSRRLALHASHRALQMKKWQEDYKQNVTALGKSHSDTISSILQQQTSLITTLIEETKLLKDQLSIV